MSVGLYTNNMYKILFCLCFLAVTFGAQIPKHIKKVAAAKIIGGVEIPIEKSPYTVQVNRNGNFSCGGVIVNKKHVLTTGWAQYNFTVNDPMSVRAGSATVNTGGTLHNVTKIVFHPKYDNYYEYNIAILTVDPPFTYDDTTKHVKLADTEPYDGKVGAATGWGSTNSVDWVFPDNLYTVDVRVISKENCDEAHSTEFCVGDRTYTACVQDQGGPLIVDGVLAGVASNTWYCGDLWPVTYTSIAQLKDFILENI